MNSCACMGCQYKISVYEMRRLNMHGRHVSRFFLSNKNYLFTYFIIYQLLNYRKCVHFQEVSCNIKVRKHAFTW